MSIPRTENSLSVEVYRKHLDENRKPYWKWILKLVSEVHKGEKVRCPFCKTEDIKLFHPKEIVDHFEHKDKEDAADCPAGYVDENSNRKTSSRELVVTV